MSVPLAAKKRPRDEDLLAPLLSHEREFVDKLKRKDRTEILRLLDRSKRTALVAADPAVPLRMQVLRSALPEAVRLSVFQEMHHNVPDKYVQWVRKAIRLPLGTLSEGTRRLRETPKDQVASLLGRTRALLDARITGHDEAKREVLKLVCKTATGGECGTSYALGLEGPPGSGKTQFASGALAGALGRPLVSVPLGGAADVSYLLGNLYTYEGSKEGRLAAGLLEARCADPIFFFDELDKVSATDRGSEIVSVLIHLIDPSANRALRDRYFHGVDLDFGKCVFVFSFNDASRVHPVLLDRIRRVTLAAPTAAQRPAILRDHVLPRLQARYNTPLALSDEALAAIAEGEGGMRETERGAEHVLATAQLFLLGGDALAGVAASPLDARGKISSAFARACLRDRAGPVASAPPLGMYL